MRFSLYLFFFFTNSSYRDVRQAGIVATMFHANEIEKVKKTLVDEKPGYDKCLLCSFVDSCVPLGKRTIVLERGKKTTHTHKKKSKSSRLATQTPDLAFLHEERNSLN